MFRDICAYDKEIKIFVIDKPPAFYFLYKNGIYNQFRYTKLLYMTNFLVGHRGASADKPENTLCSFQAAVAHGMNTIELDLVQSRDGVPFVMHDDQVDRTSNGSGYCYDLPWSAVSRLDAGSWKRLKFRGEKVSSFAEVLNCFQNQPLFMLVEIKENLHYQNLPQRTARLIQEKGMEHQCQVMSFNWDYVDAVKQENPACVTGILGSGRSCKSTLNRAQNGGHNFISWDYKYVTPAMVQLVHEAGLTLNVWTVNKARAIQKMIDLGVDSISSNHTRRLIDIADTNGIIPLRPTFSGPSPDHK